MDKRLSLKGAIETGCRPGVNGKARGVIGYWLSVIGGRKAEEGRSPIVVVIVVVIVVAGSTVVDYDYDHELVPNRNRFSPSGSPRSGFYDRT